MFDSATITILIAIFGGVYAGVFRYIVYEMAGLKKVMEKNKEMQAEMKKINKKYIDAAKARRDNELRGYEEKMNKMAVDMMKSQLMPMLVTIPLLFVSSFIATELRVLFSDYSIALPFSLPVPQASVENFINWRDTFGPVGWFWIMFMVFSFASQVKLDSFIPKKKQESV